MRTRVVAIIAAVLFTIPGAVALAADPTPEQIEQAKGHFAKGRELYDAGDKKGAVEEFKAAYRLSKNAVLLYNVGLVYDELGDKRLAVQFYQKFIIDAPDNEKTKGNKKVARERLKILEKDLENEEAAPPPEKEKPVEKPVEPVVEEKPKKKKPANDVTEFTHEVLDEAPPGKPIDLAAKVPGGSEWRLTLYYRPQGKEDFTAVQMKPRFTELVGRIPPEATSGTAIQYYIEVKDKAGKMLSQSGSAASPNIIYMEPKARAHFYKEGDEDAGDEAVEEAKPAGGGDEDTAGGAAVDDEDPLAGGRHKKKRSDDEIIGDGGDGGGGGGGGRKDGPSRNYVKWGMTGGSAALIGTSVVLLLSAKRYGDELELSANAAQSCPSPETPPCEAYTQYERDLEKTGKAYELWGNVTLGLGVGVAAVAGYMWWKDMKKGKKAKAAGSGGDEASSSGFNVVSVPLISPGVIGGAAIIEF